jgi:DNA-binding LytR/AlgR family response regulator
MTTAFWLGPERPDAGPGFPVIRAATITIALAVAGTAIFSMLIALSHAMQGKDLSLSGTLLKAAPSCGVLAILGIPAIAQARRTIPGRADEWRAMLTHAALAVLFAAAFTVLRALVDLLLLTPPSPELADGIRRHFVRGFGVAVLLYWAIVMATWLITRHRHPDARQVDASAEADLNAGEARAGAPASFVVRTGSRTYVVPIERVEWIEAQGNYVALHADGRSHLVRHTMKSLAACLDQSFVRVQRSAMVRLSAIREIRTSDAGDLVILHDGSALKVSRRMRAAVIAAMATNR